MIDLSTVGFKRSTNNYSNCPLKKRPIKYDVLDSLSDTENNGFLIPASKLELEPENLTTKPIDLRLRNTETPPAPSTHSSPKLQAQILHTNYLQRCFHNPAVARHAYQSNEDSRSNMRPLEPISFNPQYLWPNNSSFHHLESQTQHHLSQNYMTTSTSEIRRQPSQLTSHQAFQPPKQEFPKTFQNHFTMKESKMSLQSRQPDGSCFLRESVMSHLHSHRPRSLSSGSDRSSPLPDSSSLSPCSISSATTSTSSTSSVHVSIRYSCPDCSKSYSTSSGLSKHLQFHCASQSRKSLPCKFCDKVYTSLGALKMHIRTHTLPCKCTVCGKAFSRPWLLQGHVRTHTGEKPFSCDYCHRAFADRSNLRAHLQTHSEVKKYSCQLCCKTFSRTSLLVKHRDSRCGASGHFIN